MSCSHQFRLKRKKMKEFQEANYARVRRRGPRRSSSDIARAKIQGKRHRVSRGCSASCFTNGPFSCSSPTGQLLCPGKKGMRPALRCPVGRIAPSSKRTRPLLSSPPPHYWLTCPLTRTWLEWGDLDGLLGEGEKREQSTHHTGKALGSRAVTWGLCT